jgi:hypothetical protein
LESWINDGAVFEDIPDGVKNSSLADRTFHNMHIPRCAAALKDPDINVPAVRLGKHIQLLSEAANSHTAFTGSSNVMKLDKLGNVKIIALLTSVGSARRVTNRRHRADQLRRVEQEDYEEGPVAWRTSNVEGSDAEAVSARPAELRHAAPDGTTILLGGNGGILPGIEAWSLHLQHFIPGDSDSPIAMPGMDMCNKLAKSLIPRDDTASSS